MHQIIAGHDFHRFARFAPGRQSADDHKRVESFFPQHMRHTGAGGFAQSSTVKINIFVLGQPLDFFIEIIWLDANRSLDAGRTSVVITVTANIHQ
jgi:hypothetical protein